MIYKGVIYNGLLAHVIHGRLHQKWALKYPLIIYRTGNKYGRKHEMLLV
jgi:hypothetical protein